MDKLSAAIDRGLDAQLAPAAAHGASIARDRRAADKLMDCVGGLLSADAFANGLATVKPYSRQQQTIEL